MLNSPFFSFYGCNLKTIWDRLYVIFKLHGTILDAVGKKKEKKIIFWRTLKNSSSRCAFDADGVIYHRGWVERLGGRAVAAWRELWWFWPCDAVWFEKVLLALWVICSWIPLKKILLAALDDIWLSWSHSTSWQQHKWTLLKWLSPFLRRCCWRALEYVA